jgi:hypothetical protein
MQQHAHTCMQLRVVPCLSSLAHSQPGGGRLLHRTVGTDSCTSPPEWESARRAGLCIQAAVCHNAAPAGGLPSTL